MTDKEVMQMALDALESLQAWPETLENFKRFRAIEALRTALAETDVPESCFGETEPVAWVSDREARMVWWNDKFTHISQAPPRNTPLYTAPPQRERVQFPTMLRKMWSGTEVQAWLDEHVNRGKNT